MHKNAQSGKVEMVFVLKFWLEANREGGVAVWRAEIKELDSNRKRDKRYWAEGLEDTCKLLGKRLTAARRRRP